MNTGSVGALWAVLLKICDQKCFLIFAPSEMGKYSL